MWQQQGTRHRLEIAASFKLTPRTVYFLLTIPSWPHFFLLKKQCDLSILRNSVNSVIAFLILLHSLPWHSSCPAWFYAPRLSSMQQQRKVFSFEVAFALSNPSKLSHASHETWSGSVVAPFIHRHVLHNIRFAPSCDCISLIFVSKDLCSEIYVAIATRPRLTTRWKTDHLSSCEKIANRGKLWLGGLAMQSSAQPLLC